MKKSKFVTMKKNIGLFARAVKEVVSKNKKILSFLLMSGVGGVMAGALLRGDPVTADILFRGGVFGVSVAFGKVCGDAIRLYRELKKNTGPNNG